MSIPRAPIGVSVLPAGPEPTVKSVCANKTDFYADIYEIYLTDSFQSFTCMSYFLFLLSSFICSARVLSLTCFSLMSVNVKTF